MLTREMILQTLLEHMPELREKHRVTYLALFGSYARNEATPESDIDLTVEFDAEQDLFGMVEAKYYLAHLLSADVDLVSRRSIKPRIRDRILSEEIPVG